ncbi:MAG: cytidylate kinase-like family protein [Desulfobacterales bacterium]|nr:cytidylate kinase-like family protein [Desulfobacterales bacterium]
MSKQKAQTMPAAFADAHLEKWKAFKEAVEKNSRHYPMITVCMEPGSGGSMVAQTVADSLGFDFFHRKLLEVMSITAKVDQKVLQRLEKERLSGMEDVVSQMLSDRYLYPGLYLEYLEKVIGAISRRGSAVVVGRGANFILPAEDRLSVMIVAPRELRIQRVSQQFEILPEDAEKRIANRQKKRAAFVKTTFQKDISDPVYYDLTINTGTMSIEEAARLVCGAWFYKFFYTSDSPF